MDKIKKKDLLEEYQNFLDVLTQAVRLGLEIDPSPTNEIRKCAGGERELGVWAYTYQIIDDNGYGQGSVVCNAYTETQAKTLKKTLDEAIFGKNKKRVTTIKKELELYEIENLKQYIKIKQKEISKKRF